MYRVYTWGQRIQTGAPFGLKYILVGSRTFGKLQVCVSMPRRNTGEQLFDDVLQKSMASVAAVQYVS